MTIRARAAVLIWLALLAASILLVSRARITSDFTAFLPARLALYGDIYRSQLGEPPKGAAEHHG